MPRTAKTSGNHIPSLIKKIPWNRGTCNLDFGNGKYDTTTQYLLNFYGVTNLVFDPYNRTPEQNDNALRDFAEAVHRTITCINVLNVIEDDSTRDTVICMISRFLRPNEIAYFDVYEGSKSGVGALSSKGTWQENRKIATYLLEIQKHFAWVELDKSKRMIRAWNN